jgi:quercetin dioxygenase-like cupin family protein
MRYFSMAGNRLTLLLEGKDTANAYTVIESVVPPGEGTPLHVHHREDEGFLALAGEITLFLGDKSILLQQGDYAFAPREIPHSFKNTGSVEAIVLETIFPAGIEHFFEAAGTPLASRNDPSLPVTREAIVRMKEIAPQYGIDILPPAKAGGSPAQSA